MVEPAIVEAQTRAFIEAGAGLVSIHAENGEAGPARRPASRASSAPRPASCSASKRRSRRCEPFLGEVAFVTLLGTAIGVKGQGLSDAGLPAACARRAR